MSYYDTTKENMVGFYHNPIQEGEEKIQEEGKGEDAPATAVASASATVIASTAAAATATTEPIKTTRTARKSKRNRRQHQHPCRHFFLGHKRSSRLLPADRRQFDDTEDDELGAMMM